uniref:hypothetical protein n=1 Tax=Salmonella sp. TaxID=599 RepID=UPI001CD92021|nr:hypothetical protein [Salmonella sp.]
MVYIREIEDIKMIKRSGRSIRCCADDLQKRTVKSGETQSTGRIGRRLGLRVEEDYL